MTDIKTEIKSFSTKEEEAAKAWLGTNWVPFSAGAGTATAMCYLLHLIKLI